MNARLGLSPWVVLGLAALGVPRVVAHDLGAVGGPTNTLLVFVPIVVWLGVVVWQRVPQPCTTLLAVGTTYGVLVGIAHQLLWPWAFDTPPRLGGNLAGALSPAAESALLRTFAFGSSLLTGVAVGVVVGAVGWAVVRLTGRPATARNRYPVRRRPLGHPNAGSADTIGDIDLARGTRAAGPQWLATPSCVEPDMNVDANDLTTPILGRAEVEQLRRASPPRHAAEPVSPLPAEPVSPLPAEPVSPPAVGVWLALVVLGNLVVLAMLVLVVLWS